MRFKHSRIFIAGFCENQGDLICIEGKWAIRTPRCPAVGPKLFFLHIPKTAGTTINYIASQLWLRTRDHVENSDWRHTPTFEWFNFLSGHLCAERAIQSYRNSGFSFFTMFRDPVSQFYSHVRWLQHYAEYPPEHARKLIAPLNYQLAMELASAGTGRNNQVACLTSLLDNQVLGPVVRALFDNCQTRYMTPVGINLQVSRDDLEKAKQIAASLDGIGIQSHFDDSLSRLCAITGLNWSRYAGTRQNETPNRETDQDDVFGREACEAMIWADLELYEAALDLFRSRRGK
jgi:hypothetical protein